ncbi:hypothetical protein [Marilutibacter aestuarii]|uniref:hypothetical protein n=1 Tax=Marilutibacter aestuarii TaxID=1706195 RepID=UPI001476AD4F|nr:hypothetical protein [Lysobacter aestuarii]
MRRECLPAMLRATSTRRAARVGRRIVLERGREREGRRRREEARALPPVLRPGDAC